MNTVLIIQIIIIIVLLVLSAFFSSCETAFSAAGPMKLRALADDGDRGAERVLDILDIMKAVVRAVSRRLLAFLMASQL